MKSLADGRFFAEKIVKERTTWTTDTPVIPRAVSIETAHQFVWSLPVSVLITGAEKAAFLKEKITFARRFQAMTDADRQNCIEQVAATLIDARTEYYKARS
jgi:uncharacterized protein